MSGELSDGVLISKLSESLYCADAMVGSLWYTPSSASLDGNDGRLRESDMERDAGTRGNVATRRLKGVQLVEGSGHAVQYSTARTAPFFLTSEHHPNGSQRR